MESKVLVMQGVVVIPKEIETNEPKLNISKQKN